MRISLAVGMTPRDNTMGAHVKVPSGKWKVIHNAIDSALSLIINDVENDINMPINLIEHSMLQLRVVKGGKERFILAFLEAA